MSPFPKTPAAWVLTLSGILLLLFAWAMHWGMFAVVSGFKAVSPGGGEFAVALFGGVPAVLLSSVLLGAATFRTAWRSTASVIALGGAAVLLLSWLVVAAVWPA